MIDAYVYTPTSQQPCPQSILRICSASRVARFAYTYFACCCENYYLIRLVGCSYILPVPMLSYVSMYIPCANRLHTIYCQKNAHSSDVLVAAVYAGVVQRTLSVSRCYDPVIPVSYSYFLGLLWQGTYHLRAHLRKEWGTLFGVVKNGRPVVHTLPWFLTRVWNHSFRFLLKDFPLRSSRSLIFTTNSWRFHSLSVCTEYRVTVASHWRSMASLFPLLMKYKKYILLYYSPPPLCCDAHTHIWLQIVN